MELQSVSSNRGFLSARRIILGFCLAAAVNVSLAAQTPRGTPETRYPQDLRALVRSLAKEMVAADSPVVKKPVIEVAEKDKRLNYNLGGVRVEALEFDENNPYALAHKIQIHVAALEKVFQKEIPDDSFWRPILQKGDDVVTELIKELETVREPDLIQFVLSRREDEFEQLLSCLQVSMREFAKKRGLEARRVGRGLASDSFSVTIVRNPSDGRVRVLPYTKYVQCVLAKQCGETWTWRELLSEVESMIGSYYYVAEWPGGRQSEGRIDIVKTTTLTFRPR